ncbi:MAG: Crp/Fnr family transcriptional regulator [Bacteroidota bacterium]
MIDQFIQYLQQLAPLSGEEQEYLRQHLPIRFFKKGAHLLKQDELSRAFYFNLKGCVRMYHLVDGEEKTTFFYEEHQFISSYESFIKQKPATHYLQCIEDCQLVVISQEHAQALLVQFPRFEFLARVMMETELAMYQHMLATFITLNPEQRYLKMMKEQNALFQRIPQYYMATYLGVKAESLSRIKKRIAQRKLS